MKLKRLVKGILMLGIVSLIVTGCITSVHPLFTDQQLVFRPELLGTWQEGDEILVFKEKEGTHYSILNIEGADTTRLIGRLGKLGEHYFLDITIDPDDKKVNDLLGVYAFPVHVFHKISFEKDRITLISFAFASEWLEKLIKERRIRISHEVEEKQILLTASTEELQKFVMKYADEPKAFDDNPNEYKRIQSP